VYFGELCGMRASEAKKSAMQLLERLQMGEYATKRLDTLSKGNQQKIQLAATLLNDPQIVILDEPFSGLDPVNAMLLKDIVHELIKRDKIVLFSSHQMNYIEEFCDDIAILRGGGIVLEGSIREIKRSYDRSRIVLAGPDMGALRRLAEQQAGEIVSSVFEKDGGLLVQLRNVEDKAGLLQLLAAQGVEFDEFRVYEPSLNDIFVEYTEDGI
ncbi:MAG: ABC transporter ATP-binding protein, partial [Oscillospiraceae bacterium]